jgi:hypothetical protein
VPATPESGLRAYTDLLDLAELISKLIAIAAT